MFELFSDNEWKTYEQWILSVSIFFIIFSLALALKKIAFSKLKSWARKSTSHTDDDLVNLMEKPARAFVLLVSLRLALEPFPQIWKDYPAVSAILKVLFLIAIFWVIGRTLTYFLLDKFLSTKLESSTLKLFRFFIKLVTFTLGFLVVLDTLGISITPFIASLGVGSVAIALAAQSTFGNLLSGIYIVIDRPLRVGDFVKIGTNLEGTVLKIGWRSTSIQTLGNNIIFLPNTKVAEAELLNYTLPDPGVFVSVDVGVSYNADLDAVENVARACAKEVRDNSTHSDKNTDPGLRYTVFGDSSITLRVALKAKSFQDQYLLGSELIKAIHRTFRSKNIEIPFPQRVVETRHIQEEN